MGFLDSLDLPVLNHHIGRPVPKGESRLQITAKSDRQDLKTDEKWRRAVRKRDGMCCRWCRRHVVVCLALVPERAECHHVGGRAVKAIRHDVRNGLLLCAACHAFVTGKVNERHLIESAHTYSVDGVSYINADKPVRFRRIA